MTRFITKSINSAAHILSSRSTLICLIRYHSSWPMSVFYAYISLISWVSFLITKSIAFLCSLPDWWKDERCTPGRLHQVCSWNWNPQCPCNKAYNPREYKKELRTHGRRTHKGLWCQFSLKQCTSFYISTFSNDEYLDEVGSNRHRETKSSGERGRDSKENGH